MSKASKLFGQRVLAARKKRGWSQPALGERVGTSAAMVSRYERGEMTPSIEVALKIAHAFEVTLDALVSNSEMSEIFSDKKMLQRWESIISLPPEDQKRIIEVIDLSLIHI